MKQGDIVYVRFDSMSIALCFGEIIKCLVIHVDDNSDYLSVIPIEDTYNTSVRKDYVTRVDKRCVFIKKSHFYGWMICQMKTEFARFVSRYNSEVAKAKKSKQRAEKEESEVKE